jgi:CheY-like chemotaxis protein/HPt (histidine-containing phosphotransfer) domain-containing protein
VFTATVPTGDLSSTTISARPPVSVNGDVGDQSPGKAVLEGLRILLVDDRETNRKLISLFLTRSGATVEMVENGALALHAAEKTAFDVILMDMQMPVMDGYTATTRLRERGYEGPIIALTAHAMKGDREKCEAAGCSGYLAKPVNMDELVRTVRQAGGKPQPQESASGVPAAASAAAALKPTPEMMHSTLPADDPAIREVVTEFIDSIASRLDAMSAALASENYDELARIAHSLKGSGGTAGFNCFTEPSARIEQLAKARQAGNIDAAIREIRELQQVVSV